MVLESEMLVKQFLYMPGLAELQEIEVPSISMSRYSAHEGGKVITVTHWPPLPPGDTPILTCFRG
jgi:hypothetical protein